MASNSTTVQLKRMNETTTATATIDIPYRIPSPEILHRLHGRHYHLFDPSLLFDLVLRDDTDYHLSYAKRPFCII